MEIAKGPVRLTMLTTLGARDFSYAVSGFGQVTF